MNRLALLSVCFLFATGPLAAQQAAIRAKGIIESTETGFRFPDGTVQGTAATVTGGVPSVNGIPGAVTVVGTGTTTVSTAGGTITVSSPALYKKTRIVSPVTGNALASGTALLNALNGITDASATNRYLLSIEPGVYDLGTNQLVMKSFVDIEGAGPGATLILTARSSSAIGDPSGAGVIAAGSTELRRLSIHNAAPDWTCAVVLATSVRMFRMSEVTVRAKGPGGPRGIYLTDSDLDAFRVDVLSGEDTSALSTGINVTGASALTFVHGSVSVQGVGIPYAYGITVNNAAARVTIDSSSVHAGTGNIFNSAIYNINGIVTITNSTIEISDSGAAIHTDDSIGARVEVRHSSIKAGNSWTVGGPKAAERGTNSSLKFFASILDSQSTGSPSCFGSFYPTGLLASNCTKAP